MNLMIQARLRAAEFMPGLHSQLRRVFPTALWHGDQSRRQIALTFDDGPHPVDTPQLLQVLERHNIRATFFFLGERVQARPDLVRSVAAAGHQIGIHGFRHRAFPFEDLAELRQQLDQTRDLIAAVAGVDPQTLAAVRPPYGIFTPTTLRALSEWRYQPVMWSVVPLHWMQPAEQTISQVRRQCAAGTLLVLHEGQVGPPVAELTDTIVAHLRDHHFAFETIDRLLR